MTTENTTDKGFFNNLVDQAKNIISGTSSKTKATAKATSAAYHKAANAVSKSKTFSAVKTVGKIVVSAAKATLSLGNRIVFFTLALPAIIYVLTGMGVSMIINSIAGLFNKPAKATS